MEGVGPDDALQLVGVMQELSTAHDVAAIADVARRCARRLTGADGATFVLRDGGLCHYADEDAIGPLWKGQRFPLASCISGWAMLNRQAVAIEDIYADARIPHAAYQPTFVKSLAMAPVRRQEPIAAIGLYWGTNHLATARELTLLQTLADACAVSMANVALLGELRAAVEARDDFLAIAGHELRTPLAALLLQLQQLQGMSVATAPPLAPSLLHARLEKSVGYTQRLGRLVDELLDVSRLSAGRIELDRRDIDLAEVVTDGAARYVDTARNAGCPLTVDVPKALPVHGDRARIEQIVTNLLTNAFKYGAGNPVRVELLRREAEALLTVRDEGIGIEPAAQLRIFERFERNVPRGYGGLGLGLWIVKQIAVAHGGAVAVTSTPGAGAEFTVRLPI